MLDALLHDLFVGRAKLEDASALLVKTTVQDVSLKIAMDHGLQYERLVEYTADVLESVLGGSRVDRCQGLTKLGKPCCMPATFYGYCAKHRDQGMERRAKKCKVDAYAQRVSQMGYGSSSYMTPLPQVAVPILRIGVSDAKNEDIASLLLKMS
jgi:hypothetical protein